AGYHYGYQWWLGWFQVRQHTIQCHIAQGRGGQWIVVFPELHLVAVFTGWNDNSLQDQPLEMLQRYLLPAAGREFTTPPLVYVTERTRAVIGVMMIICVLSFVIVAPGALVHLWITRSTPRTKQRVVEVFLLYFLCGGWGIGSVLVMLGQILYAQEFAAL